MMLTSRAQLPHGYLVKYIEGWQLLQDEAASPNGVFGDLLLYHQGCLVFLVWTQSND